jgi:hypothetical protein
MKPHPLPRLAAFELAWIDAAATAIYPEPPDSALPVGIASMYPARFYDSVLEQIPLEQALGLRATLWMIALAPLFTIFKLGTIASIDAVDRVRVLERLIASRSYVVRQLTMSFKAVATLLYAKSDVARAAMSTPVRRPAKIASQDLVSALRLTSRGGALASGEHDHAAE